MLYRFAQYYGLYYNIIVLQWRSVLQFNPHVLPRHNLYLLLNLNSRELKMYTKIICFIYASPFPYTHCPSRVPLEVVWKR